MKIHKVIGLMSGTSLDGLDIAFCKFSENSTGWNYEIIKAETIEYNEDRKKSFSDMYVCNSQKLIAYDHEYGKFLGEAVNNFQKKHDLKAEFIASHGHTIFHQPEKGFTYQVGNGADLSAVSGLPVVCDFRSGDVAYGGQGAPLVPIGDQLLFKEFAMCLNLGGIANISFTHEGKRKAYDICPVNSILNELSMRLGHSYDDGGRLAGTGRVNDGLLKLLNSLGYYAAPFPKSLGKEWIERFVLPLMDSNLKPSDLLATFCKHICDQINIAVNNNKNGKDAITQILVTGGGAFNTHLIDLLRKNASEGVVYFLPERKIIMFKEALIFAFLGVLRIKNQINGLAAVTGASKDSIGGALYGDYRDLV